MIKKVTIVVSFEPADWFKLWFNNWFNCLHFPSLCDWLKLNITSSL